MKCRTCGAPDADDGEGWDGECGECADRTAELEDGDYLALPPATPQPKE